MRGDLHIHTDISDGSCSIEEVIELAKKNNLTHIAITNHDTTRGLKEAIELGKKHNIVVIPGVEISAYDFKRNRKVHVLGYNINIDKNNINTLCQRLLKDRDSNTKKQIEVIKSLGYDITKEDVSTYAKNSTIFYKQHIMKALMDKGYTNEMYSDLYDKLFKYEKRCKIQIKYIDVYDAVEAIQKDCGIAVIAHPGQLKSYELIEELMKVGIVGIEKYHPSHTEEDYKKIDELSKKYNLIVTGGSDFHGDYAAKRNIGDYTTSHESIEFIMN